MFGMYADTLARKSEQFSLDLRLHLTNDDDIEATWACFAMNGESPTEAERRIYRVVQLNCTHEFVVFCCSLIEISIFLKFYLI